MTIQAKATDIELAIKQFANERQAQVYRRYFKAEAGGYGEGDQFLGVTNPKVRLVVRDSWSQTSIDEACLLSQSPWHEARMCGILILVAQFEQAYKKVDMPQMQGIAERYLALHPYINNWDLVDLSVYKIIGRLELLTHDFALMDQWIRPSYSLWQRRMAMVSTWMHARHGFYDKLTERAELLLSADHDLLHKATGWMLREMYKHDDEGRAALDRFLDAHVAAMPSVMLSYAMEKMSPQARQYWRERRKK